MENIKKYYISKIEEELSESTNLNDIFEVIDLEKTKAFFETVLDNLNKKQIDINSIFLTNSISFEKEINDKLNEIKIQKFKTKKEHIIIDTDIRNSKKTLYFLTMNNFDRRNSEFNKEKLLLEQNYIDLVNKNLLLKKENDEKFKNKLNNLVKEMEFNINKIDEDNIDKIPNLEKKYFEFEKIKSNKIKKLGLEREKVVSYKEENYNKIRNNYLLLSDSYNSRISQSSIKYDEAYKIIEKKYNTELKSAVYIYQEIEQAYKEKQEKNVLSYNKIKEEYYNLLRLNKNNFKYEREEAEKKYIAEKKHFEEVLNHKIKNIETQLNRNKLTKEQANKNISHVNKKYENKLIEIEKKYQLNLKNINDKEFVNERKITKEHLSRKLFFEINTIKNETELMINEVKYLSKKEIISKERDTKTELLDISGDLDDFSLRRELMAASTLKNNLLDILANENNFLLSQNNYLSYQINSNYIISKLKNDLKIFTTKNNIESFRQKKVAKYNHNIQNLKITNENENKIFEYENQVNKSAILIDQIKKLKSTIIMHKRDMLNLSLQLLNFEAESTKQKDKKVQVLDAYDNSFNRHLVEVGEKILFSFTRRNNEHNNIVLDKNKIYLNTFFDFIFETSHFLHEMSKIINKLFIVSKNNISYDYNLNTTIKEFINYFYKEFKKMYFFIQMNIVKNFIFYEKTLKHRYENILYNNEKLFLSIKNNISLQLNYVDDNYNKTFQQINTLERNINRSNKIKMLDKKSIINNIFNSTDINIIYDNFLKLLTYQKNNFNKERSHREIINLEFLLKKLQLKKDYINREKQEYIIVEDKINKLIISNRIKNEKLYGNLRKEIVKSLKKTTKIKSILDLFLIDNYESFNMEIIQKKLAVFDKELFKIKKDIYQKMDNKKLVVKSNFDKNIYRIPLFFKIKYDYNMIEKESMIINDKVGNDRNFQYAVIKYENIRKSKKELAKIENIFKKLDYKFNHLYNLSKINYQIQKNKITNDKKLVDENYNIACSIIDKRTNGINVKETNRINELIKKENNFLNQKKKDLDEIKKSNEKKDYLLYKSYMSLIKKYGREISSEKNKVSDFFQNSSLKYKKEVYQIDKYEANEIKKLSSKKKKRISQLNEKYFLDARNIKKQIKRKK